MYDAVSDQSVSLVDTSTTSDAATETGTASAVKCNARIKGKNSTNLITHLRKLQELMQKFSDILLNCSSQDTGTT